MVLDTSPLGIVNFLFELACFFYATYAAVLFLVKYHQNPSKLKFYLLFVFIPIAFAPFSFILDQILYSPGVFEAHVGMSMLMMMVSIIFLGLLFFGTEIFFSVKEQRSKRVELFRKIFVPTSIILGILAAIRMWELPAYRTGFNPVGLTFFLGYLVLLVSVIVFLGMNAFQLAKKVEGGPYQKAIQNIGYFIYAFLGVFAFQCLEFFVKIEGYLWADLCWVFFLMLIFFEYRGFLHPPQ